MLIPVEKTNNSILCPGESIIATTSGTRATRLQMQCTSLRMWARQRAKELTRRAVETGETGTVCSEQFRDRRLELKEGEDSTWLVSCTLHWDVWVWSLWLFDTPQSSLLAPVQFKSWAQFTKKSCVNLTFSFYIYILFCFTLCFSFCTCVFMKELVSNGRQTSLYEPVSHVCLCI